MRLTGNRHSLCMRLTMVYYHTVYPNAMIGTLLDSVLASGWYRIAQSCITTDFITHGEKLVPVFWLRIDIRRYFPSREARRIQKRNRRFDVEILPFTITPEIEELYSLYRPTVTHSLVSTVREYLMGDERVNIFDSRMVCVRDGKKLIAVGYFDLGALSNTGILHFFHPDYRGMSLGKLLYLEEINYAKRECMQYYYPGYISTEISKFDYKLFADPDSTEVYVRRLDRWLPYNRVAHRLSRWARMRQY